MTEQPTENALRELLAEGLNLCVRARRLDELTLAAEGRSLGNQTPDHARCLTPHLWVMDQYDRDLADWEARTRKALR
ncbi:conserved protein of unknown function (plasmid) [Rhodovastum atsumiense]|uniref:Uncharacterized protein n=1 Tax=Rhodovastum atsumiense TaxID=504468 RepID=A0A5M6ITK6_9PROT|nr:hypothetical protein [Rhodovastum atsumiense]KAA5611650.1 hypothetical protein F1189_13905 [Rhodovastum atsumiense]CAH2606252.1 conserved protein of unknown function [Rhodovastum atsumiense]